MAVDLSKADGDEDEESKFGHNLKEASVAFPDRLAVMCNREEVSMTSSVLALVTGKTGGGNDYG